MKESIFVKIIFILTLGGTLFSGYLSATKLFTQTCAFNESCPIFLGYPACYFGFGLFLLLFLFSISSFIKKYKISRIKTVLKIISFVGIIFSGYFTVSEILAGFKTTFFGLSTCAYGFIFFILIFIITFIKLKNPEEVSSL